MSSVPTASTMSSVPTAATPEPSPTSISPTITGTLEQPGGNSGSNSQDIATFATIGVLILVILVVVTVLLIIYSRHRYCKKHPKPTSDPERPIVNRILSFFSNENKRNHNYETISPRSGPIAKDLPPELPPPHLFQAAPPDPEPPELERQFGREDDLSSVFTESQYNSSTGTGSSYAYPPFVISNLPLNLPTNTLHSQQSDRSYRSHHSDRSHRSDRSHHSDRSQHSDCSRRLGYSDRISQHSSRNSLQKRDSYANSESDTYAQPDILHIPPNLRDRRERRISESSDRSDQSDRSHHSDRHHHHSHSPSPRHHKSSIYSLYGHLRSPSPPHSNHSLFPQHSRSPSPRPYKSSNHSLSRLRSRSPSPPPDEGQTPIGHKVLLEVVNCLMHRQDCQIPNCPCKSVQRQYRELLSQDSGYSSHQATCRMQCTGPAEKKQRMRLPVFCHPEHDLFQNQQSDVHPHFHLHQKSHIRHVNPRYRARRQRSKSVDLTPVVESVEPQDLSKLCPPHSDALTRNESPDDAGFYTYLGSNSESETYQKPMLLREISISANNLPALCLNDCPLTPSPLRENRTLAAVVLSPMREDRIRWFKKAKPALGTLQENSTSVDSSTTDDSTTSSRAGSQENVAHNSNTDVTSSVPKHIIQTVPSLPESGYETTHSDSSAPNSLKMPQKPLVRMNKVGVPGPESLPPIHIRSPSPLYLPHFTSTGYVSHRQEQHTSSSTHQLMEEDRQEASVNQLAEQSSISAPTSLDFICAKPDCPCQRDRCSYHNRLVLEFESQNKTYADYGQLATDEEMLDSSSHAQQKLTQAKRVRTPVKDSACNQSGQRSSLQITDKFNPSVPFMDGMDVIECDSLGGHYYNSTCDFVLEIPKGAVSEGTTIQIEVGVTLYGPFQFPENARPISPIVWLCVRQPQPKGFKFLKPIKITLPHYLDLTDGGEENLELGFLKAGHHLNQNGKYQFMDIGDRKATFQPEYGVIHTDHFCYLCLKARSGIQLTSRSLFCLHRIVPKPVTKTAWDIIFCVTFSLRLCIESVKQQYPESDFKITSKRFKFKTRGNGSKPRIKIHFNPHPPGEWQLVLESQGSEITPSEVEFWNKEVDEMELMHTNKEYPPRFTIEVSGEQAVHGSSVEVTFTGVDDHYLGSINTRISLLHPSSHIYMHTSQMHHERSTAFTRIPRAQSDPGLNDMVVASSNGAAMPFPGLVHTGHGSTSSRSESISSGTASVTSGFESSGSQVVDVALEPSNAVEISDTLRECGFSLADWGHLACRLCKNIDVKAIPQIQNPSHERCLQETICQWLHKDPGASWRKLGEAVGRIAHYGPALTERILRRAGKIESSCPSDASTLNSFKMHRGGQTSFHVEMDEGTSIPDSAQAVPPVHIQHVPRFSYLYLPDVTSAGTLC